jgi:hypothetical protein
MSTTRTLSKPQILFQLTKEEMMDLFHYEKDTRTGNIQIDYHSPSFIDFEKYLKNNYNSKTYNIQYMGFKINPYNETHVFIGHPKSTTPTSSTLSAQC